MGDTTITYWTPKRQRWMNNGTISHLYNMGDTTIIYYTAKRQWWMNTSTILYLYSIDTTITYLAAKGCGDWTPLLFSFWDIGKLEVAGIAKQSLLVVQTKIYTTNSVLMCLGDSCLPATPGCMVVTIVDQAKLHPIIPIGPIWTHLDPFGPVTCKKKILLQKPNEIRDILIKLNILSK